jgi:hypothetical protein
MPSAIGQVSAISPLTGQTAPKEMLVDVAQLERDYYTRQPDVDDPQINWSTSEQADTGVRPQRLAFWPSPRQSAINVERARQTARCTWARIWRPHHESDAISRNPGSEHLAR